MAEYKKVTIKPYRSVKIMRNRCKHCVLRLQRAGALCKTTCKLSKMVKFHG